MAMAAMAAIAYFEIEYRRGQNGRTSLLLTYVDVAPGGFRTENRGQGRIYSLLISESRI